MESEAGLSDLDLTVFFTRTGIHFARKRYRQLLCCRGPEASGVLLVVEVIEIVEVFGIDIVLVMIMVLVA
jgi:hypothetical protein